jgi:hypothetical protein
METESVLPGFLWHDRVSPGSAVPQYRVGTFSKVFWSNPGGHLVKGDKLPTEVKYDNGKETT